MGVLYKYSGIPVVDTGVIKLNIGTQYKRGESMKWEDGFAVVLQRADCANCDPKIYFMEKVPPKNFVKVVGGKYLALAREQKPAQFSDSNILESEPVDMSQY